MKYHRSNWREECSGCNKAWLRLNDLGLCAACYSNMQADGLSHETRVIEKHYIPSPTRKTLALIAIMSGATGALIVRLVETHVSG